MPAGRRRAEFGPYRFAGFSLLPAGRVAALAAEPGDLVRAVWRPAEAAGELRVVDYGGTYIDSGTAADYLAANLHEALRAADGSLVDETASVSGSASHSVIGAGAVVSGTVDRTVVWPGCVVAAGERLTDAIRYGDGETVHAGRLRRPDAARTRRPDEQAPDARRRAPATSMSRTSITRPGVLW